jgi:hypothetical protein
MARRIAGVVALALLSVLMAATCAAGPAKPFDAAWAERNRFQVNDTLGEFRSVSLYSIYTRIAACLHAYR